MIDFKDIFSEFLRRVPGARETLSHASPERRMELSRWPEEADLYDFLLMNFMHPILLPELSKESPDSSTLRESFSFIEDLTENPDEHIQGALEFQVFDQFVVSEQTILKAFENALPYSRQSFKEFLMGTYPNTYRLLIEKFPNFPPDRIE
ncbi:hypothetical protein ACIO3O_27410 [Streptomyces sp. NPDC087440]|uniref:hypothetical protein n=1 Tax=Streptomyces sp. NPDC087440 TaxID=3365790 RepID=UPI003830D99C